jgi:hypothetical protein
MTRAPLRTAKGSFEPNWTSTHSKEQQQQRQQQQKAETKVRPAAIHSPSVSRDDCNPGCYFFVAVLLLLLFSCVTPPSSHSLGLSGRWNGTIMQTRVFALAVKNPGRRSLHQPPSLPPLANLTSKTGLYSSTGPISMKPRGRVYAKRWRRWRRWRRWHPF